MSQRGRGHIRNILDQRFGFLVVRKLILGISKEAHWECDCDCGGKKTVRSGHLINGIIKSCGCYRKQRLTSHGQSTGKERTPEYSVWAGMLRRCRNKNDQRYKDYGGRGIAVCTHWEKFENFFEDMGRRPGPEYSIERKNNSLGYFKENCRWATRQEQGANKRNNRRITFQGESLSCREWAKRTGLPKYLIRQRLIRDQWTPEKTLTTPTH